MIILLVHSVPSAVLSLHYLGNYLIASDKAITVWLEITKTCIASYISEDVMLYSRCEKLCCRRASVCNYFKASHKECERLSIQVYQEVSLSAVA